MKKITSTFLLAAILCPCAGMQATKKLNDEIKKEKQKTEEKLSDELTEREMWDRVGKLENSYNKGDATYSLTRQKLEKIELEKEKVRTEREKIGLENSKLYYGSKTQMFSVLKHGMGWGTVIAVTYIICNKISKIDLSKIIPQKH